MKNNNISTTPGLALIKKNVNKVKLGVMGLMMSTVLPVYAENSAADAVGDADDALRSILNLVFNLMAFGGIILTGYGIVLIAKAVASPEAGDHNGITKGVGALIGGILMIVIKPLLASILGVNFSTISFTS